MRTHYRNRVPELRLGHQVTVGLNDADAQLLQECAAVARLTKVEVIRLAIRRLHDSMLDALCKTGKEVLAEAERKARS
jgi:hypothetical protein